MSATIHNDPKEEDLDSDVEMIERSLPIPGHRHSYEKHLRSESIPIRTLSDQGSVSSSSYESDDSNDSHESVLDNPPENTHSTAASSIAPEVEIDGRTPHVHSVPHWFPQHIKTIYEVDRKGGSLKFNELDEMTAYHAQLVGIKRTLWRTYLDVGKKRYQFQKWLRKHPSHKRSTPLFYRFQRRQYKKWKEIAFEEWTLLEKVHLGIRVLDETIHLNFRMERLLYEKRLGGRFRG